MEPRKYPASILPIAEVCPGVLDLVDRGPYMTESADALWRAAFGFGSAAPTAHTIDEYKKAKERLTDLVAVDVEAAIEDYQMATRAADPFPSAHRARYAVDSDSEGRVPAAGPDRITGTVDCAWVVTGEHATHVVVMQHELARMQPPHVMELDLVFLGIVMGTLYGVDAVKLGRCIHAPGKAPVYKWSALLEAEALEDLWRRIVRIFRKPRALVMSDLCESCPMRRACPQWTLPIAHGAQGAYRMLTAIDGPIASNDTAVVRRFSKALRETADLIDGHLRSMKREGLG